jgi:hypothetical protein
VAKQVEKALLARTTKSRAGSCREAAPACGSCAGPMRRFRGRSELAMSRLAMFKFRLYVAGDTQNSALAIANLRALPGTPAKSARDRSRGCVSGTEARDGGQYLHDADSRQALRRPRCEKSSAL